MTHSDDVRGKLDRENRDDRRGMENNWWNRFGNTAAWLTACAVGWSVWLMLCQ